MKLEMRITVQDNEGRASHATVNGLMVATALPGMDPDAARADFLAQVDSLVRTVVERQVPALYEQVLQDVVAGEKASETDEAATVRTRKRGAQEKPEKPERNSADPVEDGGPYGPFAEEDGR